LSEAFSSFWLKPKFRFTWIPSTFLFFPSPWENLTHRYGFPLFLYTLAYIYQRIIFQFIKLRGDLFVITNDCDKAYFPRAWQQRIFAFYGGVNSEQIQSLAQEQIETKYDVVFCSRLCTQKGIMPFLDIWSRVIQHLPEARLAIIGNGVPTFEKILYEKADKLKLAHTITWLGYVNNTDKYRVYRASRLFVHPTVYDNNGMVAAEALCTGLPVVMNDLPSLRDVYTIGCAKMDFSNYDQTAQLLVQFLTDPIAYQQLKPTHNQVVELRTQWDWTNRCKQFESFCAPHMSKANKPY
jgi:glycosyltransferase involved in cell wall biosynthesis